MKPRYLLDTNICIHLLRHQPPAVAARFEQCARGEVAVSAITMAELEYGVELSVHDKALARAALDHLLEDLAVATFGAGAASAYGPVRLASPARTHDALDKLIAAHATSLDATLVTNNVADFARFPGLRVENWI